MLLRVTAKQFKFCFGSKYDFINAIFHSCPIHAYFLFYLINCKSAKRKKKKKVRARTSTNELRISDFLQSIFAS